MKKCWNATDKGKAYNNSKSNQYRNENIKKVRETEQRYRDRNRLICRLRINDWRKNNLDKSCAKSGKYRASKLQAIPEWADLTEIERIYLNSRDMTKYTGVKHHVDHVVPLKGKLVCGLHVENNLQIITAKENNRKSNKFN